MRALDGVALRTDKLAAIVGGKRDRLDKDGLVPLQRQGLVCSHRRLGFYRPDAPPEELAEQTSAP